MHRAPISVHLAVAAPETDHNLSTVVVTGRKETLSKYMSLPWLCYSPHKTEKPFPDSFTSHSPKTAFTEKKKRKLH